MATCGKGLRARLHERLGTHLHRKPERWALSSLCCVTWGNSLPLWGPATCDASSLNPTTAHFPLCASCIPSLASAAAPGPLWWDFHPAGCVYLTNLPLLLTKRSTWSDIIDI